MMKLCKIHEKKFSGREGLNRKKSKLIVLQIDAWGQFVSIDVQIVILCFVLPDL